MIMNGKYLYGFYIFILLKIEIVFDVKLEECDEGVCFL